MAEEHSQVPSGMCIILLLNVKLLGRKSLTNNRPKGEKDYYLQLTEYQSHRGWQGHPVLPSQADVIKPKPPYSNKVTSELVAQDHVLKGLEYVHR